MSLTLNAGFSAINGDTVDATYLNNFVNTGYVSLATGRLEAVGLATRLGAHLVNDNITFAIDGKIDRTAGLQIQRIANLLGDGDLTLAGKSRRHGMAPFVLR